MGRNDLDIITQMENILKVPLVRMDLQEIDKTTNYYRDYKRGYAADENGVVTGLRLERLSIRPILELCAGLADMVKLTLDCCQLDDKDLDFLKDNGRLVSLNLSNNRGISDFSFLRELKELTSVDLRNTGVTNVSFLRELKRLTAVDLSSNKITDVSFLQELKGLTVVGLRNNYLTDSDASFLRELKGLTAVSLGYNNLTNISFLQELKGLTAVELSGNELTNSDVSFLRELKGLTEVDLSSNKLTDISFLRELEGLTEVNLSSNKLTDISFLRELKGLTSVDLRNNNLIDSDISFLQELKELTVVALSGNKLTNSDVSFLRELKGLTAVYLGYNNLTNISFLQELKGLTAVALSGNELTNSDVYFLQELKGLTAVSLCNNNLTNVSFLRELKKLKSVDLSYNNLTEVSSLQELKALTAVNLSVNTLTDVSSLCELKGLISLMLKSNNLTNSDVSFLRKLKGLTAVDLSNNKLTDFTFIRDLPHLTSVRLHDNPIKTPPPEIIEQGLNAMRDYFRSLQVAADKKVQLNEVKVLLVGDGGAGKTSLLKQLRKHPFDPNQNKTHGIDIHTLPFDTTGLTIHAHFWDFGGQEIMHASHQFFMSKRSLYILVVDGREEQNPQYWLKHIETFGGNSPVLVVINKIDQHPAFDLNRQTLQRKYPNIVGFLRTSCSDGNGIEELRAALLEHLPRTELLSTPVAASWMAVKDKLREETNKNCYISHTRFKEICDNEHIPAEGTTRNTLVRFLNELGIVLHFSQLELKAFHVLNPRWVTEGVYRIINSPSLAEQEGLLKTARLDHIINHERLATNPMHPQMAKRTYTEDEQRYILDLMGKFELCYKVDTDTVLVPALLSNDEPKLEPLTGEAIHFLVEYDFLPRSVMPRLLIKLHEDNNGLPRWRNGMKLKNHRHSTEALVRADETENTLFIAVTGTHRREYLTVIRDALGRINDDFAGLKAEEMVPLPLPDSIQLNLGSKTNRVTEQKATRMVAFNFLVGYEESGERYYLDGKTKIKYDVTALLDTVSLKEDRRRAPTVHGGIHDINIIQANYQEARALSHAKAEAETELETEKKPDPETERLKKENRRIKELSTKIEGLVNDTAQMGERKTYLDAKAKNRTRWYYVFLMSIPLAFAAGVGTQLYLNINLWNKLEPWIWLGGVVFVAIEAVLFAFTGRTFSPKDLWEKRLEKKTKNMYLDKNFDDKTHAKMEKDLDDAQAEFRKLTQL